jgi:DNA-directed RNA polymerase specialized sigma subunit
VSQLDFIKYKPIPEDDRPAVQHTLAIGNQVIYALADRPGMTNDPDRRNSYRRHVLYRKPDPTLTAAELAVLARVTPHERAAVQAVERVKWPLVEGHVAKLLRIVTRKVPYARFFRATDSLANLKDDLSQQGLEGLLHAIYTYRDPETPFINYMTTVVYNRLTDYCKAMPQVSLTEAVSERVQEFYSVRATRQKQGLRTDFEAVVRVMVENALLEAGEPVTEGRVERALREQAAELEELRKALKRTVSVSRVERVLGREYNLSTDWLADDVAGRLSDLERACLRAKLDGRMLKDVAAEHGVTGRDVTRAFRRVKRLVGSFCVSAA